MRSYNVLFNMETRTIGMIKSDCNFADGQQHKRIEVPDQYPSFSQIKMWYYNDLCTIEHQYNFCINMFVNKYEKVVAFLLFLLAFAALYSLLLSEKVERTDVSFLSGTDQFSQPLLEKMA
jgi:ubiquitin-protein ligase